MFELLPTSWTPFLKFVLPGITILALLAYVFLREYRGKALRILLGLILAATALLAGNEYLRGNHHFQLWLNSYEFYHYYLGSKYMEELGYTQLYNATLAADAEAGVPRMVSTARNLETGEIVPAEDLLEHRYEHTAAFSRERWREFYRDITFFRNRAPHSQWQQQLNDKGYNGTPVWTMLGGSLANWVSTEDSRVLEGLVYIDVVLLGLALLGVAWAFGPRAALLLLIFLGTHYLMSHNTLRAAFIRLDWLACLVLAPCFLKKGYPTVAGGLLAWAAMSRIFPIIFVFGVAARWLYEVIRYRQTHRDAQDFLLSFGLVSALLMGLSVWYAGGVHTWVEFFDKVLAHNSDIAPWRIGFKDIFLMTWSAESLWGIPPETFFAQYQWLWWSIQGLVLGICFYFVRRMELHEALLFSFIPAYFLIAPTYYYYIMLMLPMLYFATRLDRPMWSLGLVYIFATGIVGHVLYGWWERGYPLFFVMSCMMGVLVLYMLLLTALEQRRVQRIRREIEQELDWLDADIPQTPARNMESSQ